MCQEPTTATSGSNDGLGPAVTYLIYLMLWEGFVFGGCAYLVFWRDASAWWFVLAVFMSAASYSPKKWRELFCDGAA